MPDRGREFAMNATPTAYEVAVVGGGSAGVAVVWSQAPTGGGNARTHVPRQRGGGAWPTQQCAMEPCFGIDV